MNFFFCSLVIIFAFSLIDAEAVNVKCKDFDVINYLFAVAVGDLKIVKKYKDKKFDLGSKDYDNRTALHVAASENHLKVAKYLLDNGVTPRPKDRYNNEPLDDAKRYNRKEMIKLLEETIKRKGKGK